MGSSNLITMSLSGRICLVTGASKGIGRGIAVQLGSAGATVYITGRSKDKLEECAAEIKSRGGKAIPVAVDHSNDVEVAGFFERIKEENNGKLDVLVNNAYAGVDMIGKNSGKKFYVEDPSKQWDCINGVGLRNHFLCTVYASRIMTKRNDRLAADCAVELKDHNVTMISLWPGPVKTEYIKENVLGKEGLGDTGAFTNAESVEFSGKAITKLAIDPKRLEKTGKILFVCDLAREYDFTDEDGDIHDIRSLGYQFSRTGHTWIASIIPGFLRVPSFLLHLAGNKF